jgi:2-polyprenyl-6-methoxyphenol hydroxylase-like FAD-dependent oxidoreductase
MAQHILVIGAGISGLATAVALQRRGHDVTVIEERTDTSSGAGISIWPNALAALDEIGLGDAVREAGGRVTAGALRWRDGTWLRHPAPKRLVKALGEPLVVIGRSALTEVLSDALADGTVRTGLSARELVTTGDGVRVTLSDATTRTASAVIGADGTRSVVARHLNGALADRYVGYTAWRGVAACIIDPDVAGEVLGPGIEFGHVPLGSDRTYWFATERAPQGDAAPQDELDYLKVRFASWTDPIPAVLAATDPDDVVRNDLYDRDQAGSGPGARSSWWATRRTRCGHIWVRADVRASRMQRCWPGSSTATTTWPPHSPVSWRFAGPGCARWLASRSWSDRSSICDRRSSAGSPGGPPSSCPRR